MRFAKGHGTENDFLLIPDPDGRMELTSGTAAALCDRRTGLGADGVLRVVRSLASGIPKIEALAGTAEWFMDCRNADGSVGQMCGNGARVFARFLVDTGLAAPGTWSIATMAGPRRVTVASSGDISVDMGTPEILGPGTVVLAGREHRGHRVSMGNPHLACPVDIPIADLDLTSPPGFDASVFGDGVNVEFFQFLGDRHIAMRVHERGVGETRSCGTGAVAAAVAAALTSSASPAGILPKSCWRVDVPGGRLTIMLDDRSSHLSGPAVVVAEGEVVSGAFTR
ncbi:diaminopimelate epimerase [Streptosporangium sp. NPDC051022]|uniref:diaminopimelate epimerase n=1 Tax=Streptosporangium sp. NPDC051022 TaxID=3155752 RepID=UPI003437C554